MTDMPRIGTADHARLITHGRHDDIRAAMLWLCFSHLPLELRSLSEPTYVAAMNLLGRITTDTPELTTALNTLVEAKDWAVRAGIRSDFGHPGPVARPQTVVDPPTDWAKTARDLTSQDEALIAEHLPNFGPVPKVTDLKRETAADTALRHIENGQSLFRPIQDRPQA